MKRKSGRDEYIDAEKRARQDLSYLFHIPPIPRNGPQRDCELKLPLFPHQKRSLHRMFELEEDPHLKDLGTFKDLTTKGGVVADTVGLGKTAEVIALMTSRSGVATSPPRRGATPVKANLVVVPAHLCSSWITEIQKFSDLRAIVGKNSIPHSAIIDADVIVLAVEFLCTESYLLAVAAGGTPLWHNYVFRRIIWDECHDSIFLRSTAMDTFRSLQSDNVWCVSGTPFPHADESIFAINTLLGIRLKINLTNTPFSMSTNRKIPQSDVFTRLKARIYLRNTPETAGQELAAASPSPFPVENSESGGVATAGYTEDVFYVDLCDAERMFYRDEALRTGYVLPNGNEASDAWHSKFVKLRMFCSAPLVGSLANDAELEGEDVVLAPLVDREVRKHQEGLFRLSLEQLRVHVIGAREREFARLEAKQKSTQKDIAGAKATIAIVKQLKLQLALGALPDFTELKEEKWFRTIPAAGGVKNVDKFEDAIDFAKSLQGIQAMDDFISTTEKWIQSATNQIVEAEREKAETIKSKEYFQSASEKIKAMQASSSQAAPLDDGEDKENRPISLDSDDETPITLVGQVNVDRMPGKASGVSDGDEEPESCLICSEELIDVAMPPCGHYACPKCLDSWITLKGSCPTCRKQTSKSEIATFTIRETQRHLPRLVARYGTKPAALIRMLQASMADTTDPDPRFIIFSQYDRMLHVLAASLKAEGIESVTCRGNRAKKDAALVKFRTSPTCRVLMMSLSNATAAGTNLQNANHVIIVEGASGVNPAHCIAVETQAIGRTVRLGQRRQVKVTRFICRNTIEERLYRMILERGDKGRDLVGAKHAGGKSEVIEILDD